MRILLLSCPKTLVPLLSRCIYIDQLVPLGTPAPTYDADATLMSLPAIFADTDETVPCEIPYLYADPELTRYWQQRLAHDTNFKVGICWQVDVTNDKRKLPIARRGYPLECFAPLSDLENISFYSLQKYDGTEQLNSSSFALHVFESFDEQSGPFMDTAALMKNLDLVVTVEPQLHILLALWVAKYGYCIRMQPLIGAGSIHELIPTGIPPCESLNNINHLDMIR